ncbi:MAG: quercetin 2,3-dioxygenase [Actinomycetota bacterium]
MSLPQTTSGYALGPDDGEAVWFNGGLGLLKATAEQTQGRFAAFELVMREGFSAPLHVHRDDDEFFLVLDGEIRIQLGDDVIDGVPGSLVYGPRDVPHSFRVDSKEARILLFFGPAGVEGFFREGSKPARSRTLPPKDEELLDKDALMAIAKGYGQKLVGPPLGPRTKAQAVG